MEQVYRDSVAKLAELIQDIEFAMLTTVEADGCLHSRPMATQKAPFTGDLWFFTAEHSPKVHELERDHHVSVTYADPKRNRYVAVVGRAEKVRDPAKMRELWNPLYKAWFPKGLDDPNLLLLRIHVERAEYWDSPSSAVVQLAGFVKAVATGKPYKPGPEEHRKLDLTGT